MTQAEVRQSFLHQAGACEDLGSPFTAKLCRLMASRLSEASDVERAVLNWPSDPEGTKDALALRLAGALHALVLSRADRDLVAAYPPHQADDEQLWAAVPAAFRQHEPFLIERLGSAPQTNEVRRSSALLPGFMAIVSRFSMPLRLLELGASAGLNLHWDRYHYDLGGTRWGDPASPVGLRPDWEGPAPENVPLQVVQRAACDLNPPDLTVAADRLRLLSYIWADQEDRLERTRAAMALAAESGITVERADAVDWLRGKLAEPVPECVTVVYHSVAWQYLPPPLRAKGDALITQAGRRATPQAPLARLQMEADGHPDGAALRLQLWPGEEDRVLGRADFHGRWVKWKG